MLNEFLKVAYAKSTQQREQDELVSLMKQLPISELHKIAQTGEVKLAHMLGCSDEHNWVEQFKGTPFMEQAVGIEQELLQAEMARQQVSQVENQRSQQSYAQMDQIRMKKRLLELQKAKAEMATLGQAGVPVSGTLPDQGEGVPAGTDAAGMPGNEGTVAKTAGLAGVLRTKTANHTMADMTGRLIAQRDMEKAAHQRELLLTGDRAGRILAKTAGLGGALMRVAGNNPGMLIGGLAGAAHGAFKENGGIGDALMEGAGGAAAGHAIQGIGGRMMNDKSFGDSLKGYGKQLSSEGKMLSKGLDGKPQASDAAMKRLERIKARTTTP